MEPEVHNRHYKSLPLDLIPSQLNPSHTPVPYFFLESILK
jgi:hypothetical protein